ncbi:hypothetical protein CDD82_4270 [Ophiocordyceps australis]|uniref:Uncharacterized protein n=1 Tax=Ophiocordyceps australis TaxID=1399860 RepID=A0A2C5Z491_9HYPO|nr:hypothetical protein CDD82_4270 [Ophiocordyceps australis]
MVVSRPQSSLPTGFGVFQSAPGAQLEFSPPMGTRELDGLLHAYIPTSAPITDKRASISCDFFYTLRQTGQTYKFYPVSLPATPSSAPSTTTTSPSSDSSSSSSPFATSTSPFAASWDWSAATASSASSTRASQRGSQSKPKPQSLPSRHQTRDYSSLPGMKILTRDGRDVTNSTSRGCKTKEQRDHAHLMRIIKACPDCRRKKIRCDPSHKKRASDTQRPQPTTRARARKKTGESLQSQWPVSESLAVLQMKERLDTEPASPTAVSNSLWPASTLDFDFDFLPLPGFESAGDKELSCPTDWWEQFIEYQPAEFIPQVDMFMDLRDNNSPSVELESNDSWSRSLGSNNSDLHLGSNNSPSFGFGSTSPSLCFGSNSPSLGLVESNSPSLGLVGSSSPPATNPYISPQAIIPQPCPDPSAPPGSDTNNTIYTPLLPYDLPGASSATSMNYRDFNLYSPRSSFSEDEHMVSIGSLHDQSDSLRRPSPTSGLGDASGIQAAPPGAQLAHQPLESSRPQASLVSNGAPGMGASLHGDSLPGDYAAMAQDANVSPGSRSFGGATSRSLSGALKRPAESAHLDQGDNGFDDLACPRHHLDSTRTTYPSGIPMIKHHVEDVSMTRPASGTASPVTDLQLVRLASGDGAHHHSTANFSTRLPLIQPDQDFIGQPSLVSTTCNSWRSWLQDGTWLALGGPSYALSRGPQHPPILAGTRTSFAATMSSSATITMAQASAHGASSALRLTDSASGHDAQVQALAPRTSSPRSRLKRAVNVAMAVAGLASLALANASAASSTCSVYVFGAVMVFIAKTNAMRSRAAACCKPREHGVASRGGYARGGQPAACRDQWAKCWQSICT